MGWWDKVASLSTTAAAVSSWRVSPLPTVPTVIEDKNLHLVLRCSQNSHQLRRHGRLECFLQFDR